IPLTVLATGDSDPKLRAVAYQSLFDRTRVDEAWTMRAWEAAAGDMITPQAHPIMQRWLGEAAHLLPIRASYVRLAEALWLSRTGRLAESLTAAEQAESGIDFLRIEVLSRPIWQLALGMPVDEATARQARAMQLSPDTRKTAVGRLV